MIPKRYIYIDHLKIDAEGNDLDVLKSAEDSIKRCAIITIEDNNTEIKKYLHDNEFTFLEEQKGGYSYINNLYKDKIKDIDYYIRV